MGRLQREIGRFEERGAKVLGVSVGSPWSHKAWAEERGIEFPLLSDFRREVVEDQPEVGTVLEDLEKAL